MWPEYCVEWTHRGKCRARIINYHTSHHIPFAEASWLFKGISYRSAKWVSGTAASLLAGQQYLPFTILPHCSSVCWSMGRLVKHLALLSWHLTSDEWAGVRKLTGTNYAWEAGSLKSRSAEISCHMLASCTECARPSILPVHYQHYHPVCLHSHQRNQPLESAIKWIHCALQGQFITIAGFRRGVCRPRSSHNQSSQAAAGGKLQGDDTFFVC